VPPTKPPNKRSNVPPATVVGGQPGAPPPAPGAAQQPAAPAAPAAQAPADPHVALRYAANKKEVWIAVVLWFFFGWFGAHRFYAGSIGIGVAELLFGIVCLALWFVLIGWILAGPYFIWLIIDLILVIGRIQRTNNRLIDRLAPGPGA